MSNSIYPLCKAAMETIILSLQDYLSSAMQHALNFLKDLGFIR